LLVWMVLGLLIYPVLLRRRKVPLPT
jgi:hypothetical protein